MNSQRHSGDRNRFDQLGLRKPVGGTSTGRPRKRLSRTVHRTLSRETLECRRVLAGIVGNPFSLGTIAYSAFPGETNDVQVDPNLFLTISDAPSVSQIPVPPCLHGDFLESISVSFGVSFIVSFDVGFSLIPFNLPDGVLCPSYLAGSGARFGEALSESLDSSSSSGGSAIAGAELTQSGGPYLQVEADGETVDNYELYQAVVDPNAATAEAEPNDSSATPITSGTLVTGAALQGDTDTFSFSANLGDEIVVIANNDREGDGFNINPQISLSGPGGLFEEVQGLGDTTVLGAVTAGGTGTQTLTIENTGFSNGSDSDDYSFVVLVNPASVAEIEPNDDTTTNFVTLPGQSLDGEITSDDVDVTKLASTSAGNQVFAYADTQDSATANNDTFLTLLEADGASIVASDDDSGSSVTPEEFSDFQEQLEDANVDVDGLTSLFNGSLAFVLDDQDDVADLSRVDYNLFVDIGSAILIDGGTGNDTLYAGGGINELTGGEGNDTFVFNKNFDSMIDIVEATGSGQGEDTILIEGTPGNDIVNLSRQGNDLIVEYLRVDNPGGTPTLNSRTIYDELLAGNNVERLVFEGDAGDDQIRIDSSNGPIRFSGGINFNGGDGTDRVEFTGGTASANQFFTGPDGSGTSLITIDDVTQIVNFEGMDPIVQSIEDSVAGPLELFATQYGDIINLGSGPAADLTRLTSNNENTLDFANKTALTINAGAGGNDITVQAGAQQGFAAGGNSSRVLTINGQDGDDTISVAPGLPPSIKSVLNGGSGDDLLTGGDNENTLNGGTGNDQLYGSDGADTLNGGDGDDLLDGGLSLNNTLNNYNGGDGVDTILVTGDDLDNEISGEQSTNSAIMWSIDDLNNRFDVFSNVEQFSVDTLGGDDAISLTLSDSLTLSTRYLIEGGPNQGADVLTFVDSGPGDLILHRQGSDNQSGTIYPDALGPLVYTGIENVEVTPVNPVTGGTGADGNGRVVVLDQDPFEFNDTLLNATDFSLLGSVQHNLAIDVGGDDDWFRFRAPKIGTFTFELLFERVATLPVGGELRARLYRQDGTLIANSTDVPDGDVVSFSADHLEDYYLQIDGINSTVLNAYDLNLVEVDLVGPQVFDPDGAGPQQAIQIGGDANFNLFDPKALDPDGDPQGPTPEVESIVINLQDILNRLDQLPADLFNRPVPNGRAPGDLYPAIDAQVAAQIGNYEIRGDANGLIPIQQVIVTNATPEVDEIPTATVELVFFEPLPDDRYTVTLFDTLVDPAGNALDGNADGSQPLANPTFPSGDNQAGGDFAARFTVDTAAEVGVWAAGSVYVDTNGNAQHDPSTGDPTHRDVTYTFGFTTDTLFAGNFYDSRINPGTIADGFDKIAAYGMVEGRFRWQIDTDNDGVADLVIEEPQHLNGLPVAGNFDDDLSNGDEVGLLTPTHWWFDSDHDFQLDTSIPTNMVGYPIVGDFDGDGEDDLGTWTQDYFSLDLSTIDGIDGQADTLDSTDSATSANDFRFGFPGPRDRPIAADFDGDGIDDLGLWVPDRSGATPQEGAEWYIFVSDERSITDRIVDFDDFEGQLTVDFTPVPFGKDLFIQFGDEFAQPIVGNFDPPISEGDSSLPEPTIIDSYDGRFHNLAFPHDVDQSGGVSLSDALVIVSALRSANSGPLYNGSAVSSLVDVNGDSMLSLTDALEIVSYLRNALIEGGEGEAPMGLTETALQNNSERRGSQQSATAASFTPTQDNASHQELSLDALIGEMTVSGNRDARKPISTPSTGDSLEEAIEGLARLVV